MTLPPKVTESLPWLGLDCGLSDVKTIFPLQGTSLLLKLRSPMRHQNGCTRVVRRLTDLCSGHSWGPWEASGPSISLEQRQKRRKPNKNECPEPMPRGTSKPPA